MPRSALDLVMGDLERFGRIPAESIAFALGRSHDGVASVKSVVLAEEPGVTRGFGHIRLSERWMLRLTELCELLEQAVVAQFHSHPDGARHSDTDDHHLLHGPDILSVVVPSFARAPAMREPDAWAVYRCGTGGYFRKTTVDAVTFVDAPTEPFLLSENGWRRA